MLILVQRPRQLEVVLFGLGIDRLRRQQRHLTIFQQLENPFDLERRRPARELAFLAALLDHNTINGVLTHKRRNLSRKHFDVGGLVVIVQGNFLGVEGDVTQGRTVEDATAMIASLPLISMPQIFISIPFTA